MELSEAPELGVEAVSGCVCTMTSERRVAREYLKTTLHEMLSDPEWAWLQRPDEDKVSHENLHRDRHRGWARAVYREVPPGPSLWCSVCTWSVCLVEMNNNRLPADITVVSGELSERRNIPSPIPPH